MRGLGWGLEVVRRLGVEIEKFGLVWWLGKCERNSSWDWELLEMATEEETAAGVAEILWCEQTVAIEREREREAQIGRAHV